MAKSPEGTADQLAQGGDREAPPKGMNAKKLLIFGVPVFLIQLVVVYFILTKFLAPPSTELAQEHPVGESNGQPVASPDGEIYVVKDFIVNPAGTNGTRFLLTTIGFNVSSHEVSAELEKKDIQVRDALTTILTSKTLDELVNVSMRDSLRLEITSRITPFVSTGRLNSVYFSKFIIQ